MWNKYDIVDDDEEEEEEEEEGWRRKTREGGFINASAPIWNAGSATARER